MDLVEAVQRALLGESVASLRNAYRVGLLEALGLDPATADAKTFGTDARRFANRVCRELGDRHGGDFRAMVALRDYVRLADEYEVYDALLSHFEFEGKDVLVRRGRALFAGPLTSHWLP